MCAWPPLFARFLSRRLLMLAAVLAFSSHCGGGSESSSGTVRAPDLVAVDSANSRVVVLDEGRAALSAIDATGHSLISGGPIIGAHDNTSLYPSLSAEPLDVVATPSPSASTTTRIAVVGSVRDASTGVAISNRVYFFDFDGSAISAPSFSPISADDGDSATDDTADVLTALAVDAAGGQLFVLNKTDSALHVYSLSDGTEAAVSPIALTGTPSRMALDGDLGVLFVGSSDGDEAAQVLTVVDLSDLSSSEIALGIPVRDLSVVSAAAGTVLAAVQSDDAALLFYTVDTLTFASVTQIGTITNSTETTDTNDDSREETLITGSLSQVELVEASDGRIFAYASQSDGNLLVAALSADLATLSSFALETRNELQGGVAARLDTGTGFASEIYTASTQDGLVVYTPVGDEDTFSRIR